jgi:predicted dehydrogenase
MSRKRGRIILVGVVGLELNRGDFYEKELTFQVSCSYGPGRYDPLYEQQGLDYPIAFVRWTEQRNFEAVLDMMVDGKIDVKPLITHQYLFEEAEQAYQTLLNDRTALGILLEYESKHTECSTKEINLDSNAVFDHKKAILGFIGAGNYASRFLIPAFKAAGAQYHTIVTSSGISAVIQGEKSGFAKASTDIDALLLDKQINGVVIATRHNTHAKLAIRALNAGKHVFVEKPIAINFSELNDLESAYHTALLQEKKPHLMVGFNRRFSPHIKKIKQLLLPLDEPKTFVMTINAPSLPNDHWLHDPWVGGGRIIGEACHFIDLMRYLAGCEIISIQCRCQGKKSNVQILEETATITLGFLDGSFGSIHYLVNGALGFPKERIELFTAGRVLQLDNFRKLKGFGWPKFKRMNLWRQDKGQQACSKSFIQSIEQGLETPIPFNEIMEVARVSIEAAQQLRLHDSNL